MRILLIIISFVIFLDNFLMADIDCKIACHEDEWINKLEKSKLGYIASSTKNERYKVDNLFDGKKETCWVPKGDGIGEFIIFEIPYGISGIRFINGLAANKKLYTENNRVKDLYIGIIYENDGEYSEFDICGNKKYTSQYLAIPKIFKPKLYDSIISQDIYFDTIYYYNENKKLCHEIVWTEDMKKLKKLYLVIGIESIYSGTKYNDTCLSEIEIIK